MEGKNPGEWEDVVLEKRVSRSLAMRTGDRPPAQSRRQDSGKNVPQDREAASTRVSQQSGQMGEVINEAVRPRRQETVRDSFHLHPHAWKSQCALIQEPLPSPYAFPRTSSGSWFLTGPELPKELT